MIDKKIFDNYSLNFDNCEIKNFWNWLINFSYLIILENGKKYFLQKINTNIFSDISALENNFKILEKAKNLKNLNILLPIKNKKWDFFSKNENDFYRIFDFIDADCFDSIQENDYIFDAAKNFSTLTEKLSEFSLEFKDTIKDFHNLEMRYENFLKTLEKTKFLERKKESSEIINFILENNFILEKSRYYKEKIPKRVYHHDAKINNVLFEKNNFFVKSIIDLDTFMAWYIFSDFWDLVWTLVFWIDHKNPKKVEFDQEKYDILTKWYLSGFSEKLSKIEEEAMHFWWIYISYMLWIRFLDDYLSWDKYFKIDFENQNFLRAKFQLEIVKDLMIIKKYA